MMLDMDFFGHLMTSLVGVVLSDAPNNLVPMIHKVKTEALNPAYISDNPMEKYHCHVI
jgi:hypothetical protein